MVGERTHDKTRRARGEKKKMVTQFFMAMRPPTCTAQEKQVRVVRGKPQFYEPQALAAARAKLCAAEHFWTDDALVCSEIAEKFWADTPGIWIHIEPVED